MKKAPPVVRPDWGFVLSHPAHFLSFGFGSGLFPFAPGTAGTLMAFPLYGLLTLWIDPVGMGWVIAACFALGVVFCERTGRALGVADYGGIVWDEIVAFLLVLWLIPQTIAWFLAGFVLFRLFDIWKPFPIRYFDRRFKGGFGVMFDDLLAAAYTLLVLYGVMWWM